MSAFACNGDIAEAELDVIAVATALALAEAIAQADIFCESSGGSDTAACGLSEGTVQQVARAQVGPPPSPLDNATACLPLAPASRRRSISRQHPQCPCCHRQHVGSRLCEMHAAV